MKADTIYQYGYNDGLRGAEASVRYKSEDQTLYVTIEGSNIFSDYIKALKTFPRFWLAGRKHKHNTVRSHPYYGHEALKLAVWVKGKSKNLNPTKVVIDGISMGGTIAPIVAYFLNIRDTKIIMINAPKAGNKNFIDKIISKFEITHYVARGDIIHLWPFFYAKWPARITHKFGKWQTFIKAHKNTNYKDQ